MGEEEMRVRFALYSYLGSFTEVSLGEGLTVETSHNRIDLSSEPEASVLPSGDHAMVEMPARWPSSMCNCFPVAVSQILMVASAAGRVSGS